MREKILAEGFDTGATRCPTATSLVFLSPPVCLVGVCMLVQVVGEPIKLKKLARTDPGFSDEVDRVHAAFVKALQDLYNEYRGTYGWADRELSIE